KITNYYSIYDLIYDPIVVSDTTAKYRGWDSWSLGAYKNGKPVGYFRCLSSATPRDELNNGRVVFVADFMYLNKSVSIIGKYDYDYGDEYSLVYNMVLKKGWNIHIVQVPDNTGNRNLFSIDTYPGDTNELKWYFFLPGEW
uniref:hypothetical protein n=1 Tax=Candidatus Symbiothrix dinenymphae TaxID=467085 RepID=UPI000A55C221